MEIRKIGPQDRAEALALVWRVFQAYEAPEFAAEGIENFRGYLEDEAQIAELEMYGAYEDGTVIGVLAARDSSKHISLLFVDGERHRQGIGRTLFAELLKHSPAEEITVNASPYAVEIYKRLGFVQTATEQLADGIRFTPMLYRR